MTARAGSGAVEPYWTDFRTTDVEASKAFYAAVFGWRFEEYVARDGSSFAPAYLADGLVTFIAPQAAGPDAAGAHGRWNVYFAAEDVQELITGLAHAGGSLESGPTVMDDSGVMVTFSLPGGGTTGAWQSERRYPSARSEAPGAPAWVELLTPEPRAAVAFFQQYFGHEVTEYPQDDGGTYTTLLANGAEVAGIAAVPAGTEGILRPGWQVYFGVSNVAESVAAAVAAGAVVLVEPDDTEEGGTIATLRDPQGAVFNLLEL